MRYKAFALTPLLDEYDHIPTDGRPVRFEVGLLSDELTDPALRGVHTRSEAGCSTRTVAVTGQTLGEPPATSGKLRARWPIRPMDRPIKPTDGLAICAAAPPPTARS